MFAIISHEGKQYKVEENKEYRIDSTTFTDDKKVVFDEVLLVDDGERTTIGAPLIDGAKVEAEKISDIRDDKVKVFKFHAKKRYKKTLGHKQKYSVVKIKSIKI